jgi:hypothetical protein
MPLLKYFIAVGAVLTIGLLWLSSYLEPVASEAGARVSVTPTTASIVAFAPSSVKPIQIKTSAVDVAPPQRVKPTHVKVSHRSR